MSNEILFWTQIGSLVVYICSVFYLYQLLVKQKDAVIESKNATIELLRERTDSVREQLEQAKQASPDILAEVAIRREKMVKQELEKLYADHKGREEEIGQARSELDKTRENIVILTNQLAKAQELLKEFLCPICSAPMTVHYYTPPMTYEFPDGRQIDYEIEITEYECGLKKEDGKRTSPCGRWQEMRSFWEKKIKDLES